MIQVIAEYFAAATPVGIFIAICTKLTTWLFDAITGRGGFR